MTLVRKDNTYQRLAQAELPTKWGAFDIVAFGRSENDPMPHLALIAEGIDIAHPVLVRIHSECITGDVFGSARCDCGEQLDEALRLCAEQGGIVLYLRQEGRGIGIINKLKAYHLQEEGLDTLQANLHLGLAADGRQYDIALQMLEELGVKQIKLLTNNPLKTAAFEGGPIELVDRIPLLITPNDTNEGYLRTKQDSMGHLLDL